MPASEELEEMEDPILPLSWGLLFVSNTPYILLGYCDIHVLTSAQGAGHSNTWLNPGQVATPLLQPGLRNGLSKCEDDLSQC